MVLNHVAAYSSCSHQMHRETGMSIDHKELGWQLRIPLSIRVVWFFIIPRSKDCSTRQIYHIIWPWGK